jgi:hypothetical protein
MDAREIDMKERMLMMEAEYSVLKEVLKYNECGWSNSGSVNLMAFTCSKSFLLKFIQ